MVLLLGDVDIFGMVYMLHIYKSHDNNANDIICIYWWSSDSHSVNEVHRTCWFTYVESSLHPKLFVWSQNHADTINRVTPQASKFTVNELEYKIS